MILKEFFPLANLQIISESKTGQPVRLKGVFQRANEININKRRYGKPILERETNKLRNIIKEGKVSLTGELDHPDYPVVKLTNASHIFEDIYMKGDDVIGEIRLLNTPNGKIAQTLIKDGVKFGISSRAQGSLSEAADGVQEVGEDLDMSTYDLVADPSVSDAVPGIRESKECLERKVVGAYKTVVGEQVLINMIQDQLKEAFNLNEAHGEEDSKIASMINKMKVRRQRALKNKNHPLDPKEVEGPEGLEKPVKEGFKRQERKIVGLWKQSKNKTGPAKKKISGKIAIANAKKKERVLTVNAKQGGALAVPRELEKPIQDGAQRRNRLATALMKKNIKTPMGSDNTEKAKLIKRHKAIQGQGAARAKSTTDAVVDSKEYSISNYLSDLVNEGLKAQKRRFRAAEKSAKKNKYGDTSKLDKKMDTAALKVNSRTANIISKRAKSTTDPVVDSKTIRANLIERIKNTRKKKNC